MLKVVSYVLATFLLFLVIVENHRYIREIKSEQYAPERTTRMSSMSMSWFFLHMYHNNKNNTELSFTKS